MTRLLNAYKNLETVHNPVSEKSEKRDLATIMDEIEQAGYANADGGLLTNDRNWHALRQAFNLVSDIDLVAEAVVTRDVSIAAAPEPTVLDFRHRGYYVQLEKRRSGWCYIIHRSLVSEPMYSSGYSFSTFENARVGAVIAIDQYINHEVPFER